MNYRFSILVFVSLFLIHLPAYPLTLKKPEVPRICCKYYSDRVTGEDCLFVTTKHWYLTYRARAETKWPQCFTKHSRIHHKRNESDKIHSLIHCIRRNWEISLNFRHNDGLAYRRIYGSLGIDRWSPLSNLFRLCWSIHISLFYSCCKSRQRYVISFLTISKLHVH